jgi:NADH-quinone oxidoreductase subunit G
VSDQGNGQKPDNLVTVSINGQSVEAEKGRLLIDVAEEMGIFIPRFCYHPGMKSVAVCRMCLVQVEGQRKLLPACATPVAEDMSVNTVDEQAVDAQQGMLEFLLINHPLDCPICDRAGECPLQDQTYRHGPGSSRYIEPKRTYEKALEISDLVVLDRERCVLCWRCVRFSDEIAGDQFIQLVDRGPGTQILTFNDEPFDSYFSGNTIQICPVGALTSKPYRFVSRPWDLETAPSVCTYCSVGCPISNEARDNKVVRCQAMPNEHVNDFWSCDKGRFGYHHVSSKERLMTPLVRGDDDSFRSVGWDEAFEAVAEKLKDAERVGVIAGGHLTTEDAFAISRLGREVLKTTNLDSRIQDAGAPYELAIEVSGAAGSSASIDDLLDAKAIVWVGDDPKETLPVLYLRLRRSTLEHGAKLYVLSPRRISLDSFATESVRCGAADEAVAVGRLGDELSKVDGKVVVCWGPTSPSATHDAVGRAVVDLAKATGGKLLIGPPHAGSQGLIDMGVHPGLEPGYVQVNEPGMDTRAILEAAAAGELDALLVFGADPIADFPDADLADRALASGVFTVVTELFPTETVSHADVVFPSVAYAEREGTFTNLERRLQKLEKLLPVPGSTREPWAACQGIAKALGTEWNWRGFDDIWNDIKSKVPTHKEVDLDLLGQDIIDPREQDQSGYVGESIQSAAAMSGPAARYPKGFRQGAPFQTGQNWPLSWELRAFEARQRPGVVPPAPGGSHLRTRGVFEGHSGDRPPTPAVPSSAAAGGSKDGSTNSFLLLTGRMIYDEGAMVSKSTALRHLQRKPYLEMNDEDVKALGISDGDEVTVTAGDFSVRLPVLISDIARGAVFVPYGQEGLRANKLLSGGNTTVTVEKS